MDLVATPHDDHNAASGEFDELGRHGHQASLADGLDFVNTLEYSKGLPHEHFTDATAAVKWFQQHALLHSDAAAALSSEVTSDEAAERLLQRIQKTRAALRELLDAAVERRPPADAALREVNRALRAPYVYELVPSADGVSLDHRHEGDPVSGALGRLAEAIARELPREDQEPLRACAK